VSHFEQVRIGEGVFTVTDVSNILNISKRRSRHLVESFLRNDLNTAMNFVYNIGSELGVFINFKSLIQIMVFHELREKGHSKKTILNAFLAMVDLFGTKYPFADRIDKILSSGSEIMLDLGGDQIVKADSTFQYAMKEILKDLVVKIDFDEEGKALRFYPLGLDYSIVIDPEIQFGSPTIKGTRVEIDNLVNFIESGDSIELVSDTFNITKKQVQDALAYHNNRIAA